MQHTIKVEIVEPIFIEIVEPIVEEIKEKVPKWELLQMSSFWIFILDLVIILSAKLPKMSFDQCKQMHDGKKRWYDAVSLASYTVCF